MRSVFDMHEKSVVNGLRTSAPDTIVPPFNEAPIHSFFGRYAFFSLLIAISGVVSCNFNCQRPMSWTGQWLTPSTVEPSGIVWHDQRETLFVVGDQGAVIELEVDGQVLREVSLGQQDFEGATYDPATGYLYFIIEGADHILEIDPTSLETRREFAVQRIFGDRTLLDPSGEGLEGLTFAPDADDPDGGTFFVANQSDDIAAETEPSAILEVRVPLGDPDSDNSIAQILSVIEPQFGDLSGLHWNDGTLMVSTDSDDATLELDREGTLIDRCPIPGINQEGITSDGERWFLADETGSIILLDR